MTGFLDIYTKLIIAIISFIAPLIAFMLSVFSEGVAILRKRTEEELDQMGILLKEDLNRVKGSKFSSLIQSSSKKFETRKKKLNNQLDLLNPKKQIVKIYSIFFMALACVMIYCLVNQYYISANKTYVMMAILAISGGFSLFGVSTLRDVAWAVIDAKEIIANDKADSQVTIDKIAEEDNGTINNNKSIKQNNRK